jgi:hypothetical protein
VKGPLTEGGSASDHDEVNRFPETSPVSPVDPLLSAQQTAGPVRMNRCPEEDSIDSISPTRPC